MKPVPESEAKAKRNVEIDELIRRSKRTQREIADYLTRRLGDEYEHYVISRMASGVRKVTAQEMDALRELAAQEAVSDPPVAGAQTFQDTGETVPLFGYAGGAGHALRIDEEHRIGSVSIHPLQRGSRSAYAFICTGDSVSPRLNHGEMGYAVRNRVPFKGQLAVVRLASGEALVKFYESQDDRTVILSQLNPKATPQILIPIRDVVGVDAVVGAAFGSS